MAAVALQELVQLADRTLAPERFQDYCPNGLQVEGRAQVGLLVSGVTASLDLLERAVAAGADAVLVHHGYFWRGESPCVTGMRRRRLALLLAHGISLLAYHLPLDAHPVLGNNACLGRVLGLLPDPVPTEEAVVAVHSGRLAEAQSVATFSAHLAERLGREPLHVGGGPAQIRRLAWCTGAAQGYLGEAIRLGVDAYVTGEISEQTVHEARENGIHCFAAGHHATERYGVQALGAHLAAALGIRHQFFDCDNPV